MVAVASLSSTSMAVGPTSRLPWTVGVTSTPLPYLPGSWKTVCRTMLPGRVVQQEVIPAPRRDVHRVRRVGHVVQRVGVDARRIDDAARFQLPWSVSTAHHRRRPVGAAGDFGVKPELHAVFGGVLGQRKGQAERADDAAGGRPQGGDGGVRMFGSSRDQTRRVYDAQPFHAVGDAVFIELLQRGAVLLAQADDKLPHWS